MSKIEDLEKLVRELYEAKNEGRDPWADWLYPNHVVVVADNATELAKRFDADPDLSRAGGLLHDIADVKMSRFMPEHEEVSLQIARELMAKAGYDEAAITLVVDDAVRYHSCFDGQSPASVEGKVLATADALAHFTTDFYLFATKSSDKSLAEIKAWVLKKLERDYDDKIQFDEIRQEVAPDYEALKRLFSR